MDFNINNDGSKVEIKITFRCGYAGDYIYTFSHNVGKTSCAGLVAEALENQFNNHIKRIRQAAYNEGWEDKKKRRTKRTDFDWCANQIKMERWD